MCPVKSLRYFVKNQIVFLSDCKLTSLFLTRYTKIVEIHLFSSKCDFNNSVIQWQHILFNIRVNNQNFVIKTNMSYDLLSKFAFN